MAVYKRDIVDINLETGNIHRSFLKHSIGYMDQKADHFGIRAYRDGVPVDLTGVSVQGVFMPPQGSPIAITSGNIVNFNEAEVVLPQACYNYDGQFTLAIKLVDSTNSVTGTMRIVDGMVDNTHASGTVAPTEAVPTYQEIIAVYEDLVDALADVADYAENFAPAFAAGTANAAGSYVMYEGDLYLLPDGHTANTTWANTTKTQVTAGGEMVKLAQADSDLKSALTFQSKSNVSCMYGNNGYISIDRPMVVQLNGNYSGASGNTHVLIPIKPNDSITLTANSAQNTAYAIFSQADTPVAGVRAPFSSQEGFTGRLSVTKNTSETFTAPSDAAYLYLMKTTSGNNYLPSSIIVNGFDMKVSLYSHIDDLRNRADVLLATESMINVSGIYGESGYYSFERPFIINLSNQYANSNYRHVIVPIKPGDSISMRAKGDQQTIYAILQKLDYPVVGDSPSFSADENFNSRKTLAAATTITFTAPSDAAFLYLTKTVSSNNYLPTIITVKIIVDKL